VEWLGVLRPEELAGALVNTSPKQPIVRKVRSAVYTRKSSEEGLEQEFNSLAAQRDACEAYIASQRAEGWVLVPDRYDDGGVSGATLERPALKRLLGDIERGLVDVVVVYKIDRLSRSLMDFAKLVDVFDANEVTFVSVTQSFNTTTSMGRLTLNILLSFAQFEREVIGERIRDKFAASRARGMWMGGWAPLGYDIRDRKLAVNEGEAALVRRIFERLVRLGSATKLVVELNRDGVRHKRGKPIDKGFLYKLLNNRLYIGEAVHKGQSHPGEHDAIITHDLWDKVHAVLRESPRKRASKTRAQTPALLKGLIFGPTGHAMVMTHTRRRGRLYRYYVSTAVLRQGRGACPVGRVPAGDVEAAVVGQVCYLLTKPEVVVRTWRAARVDDPSITEGEVRAALADFHPLWAELFPAEQARVLHLLVARVDVQHATLDIRLRMEGLTNVFTGPQEGTSRTTGGCVTINRRLAHGRDATLMTVRVPLTFRRRGGRKQVVTPDGQPGSTPRSAGLDGTLVKALARAHRWQRMLDSGVFMTVAELAKAEKINPSYLARVLRLTLLAPDIVETIASSHDSPSVTLDNLLRPFPREWSMQKLALSA
jgi:site-specific DNA recombinase